MSLWSLDECRWREFRVPLPEEPCVLQLPAEGILNHLHSLKVLLDCDELPIGSEGEDGWSYTLSGEGARVEQIGIEIVGAACELVSQAEVDWIRVYYCALSLT
jgi:hypothetical protein